MKMRRTLKHKGFINIPRRVTLLLKEGKIDFVDYGFYHFLLQEVSWFHKSPIMGCVGKSNVEIAIDSGHSESTISRRIKKLKKLGLIELTPERLIKIVNYERYTMPVAIKLGKLEVASLQEDNEQMQE